MRSNDSISLEEYVRLGVALWFEQCLEDSLILRPVLSKIGFVTSTLSKYSTFFSEMSAADINCNEDVGLIFGNNYWPTVVLVVGDNSENRALNDRARAWLRGGYSTEVNRAGKANLVIVIKLHHVFGGLRHIELEVWRHRKLEGIGDNPNGESTSQPHQNSGVYLDTRYDVMHISPKHEPSFTTVQRGLFFAWDSIRETFQVCFPCYGKAQDITVADLFGTSFVSGDHALTPETIISLPLWELGRFIMSAFCAKHPLKYDESIIGVILPEKIIAKVRFQL